MALIVGVDLRFLSTNDAPYLCSSAHRSGMRIIRCKSPSVCHVYRTNKHGGVETFPSCLAHIHSEIFEWP